MANFLDCDGFFYTDFYLLFDFKFLFNLWKYMSVGLFEPIIVVSYFLECSLDYLPAEWLCLFVLESDFFLRKYAFVCSTLFGTFFFLISDVFIPPYSCFFLFKSLFFDFFCTFYSVSICRLVIWRGVFINDFLFLLLLKEGCVWICGDLIDWGWFTLYLFLEWADKAETVLRVDFLFLLLPFDLVFFLLFDFLLIAA